MSEYYLSDSSRQQLEQEVRELRQREDRLVRNVKKLRAQVRDLTSTGGGSYHRLKVGEETVGYRQTVNQFWDVSLDSPVWQGKTLEYEDAYGLTELPMGLRQGGTAPGEESYGHAGGRHLKRMGKRSNNSSGK